MCGLAGFVGAGDRDDLTAMAAAIAHRGPDGDGFHIESEHGLFLAHRRLAILDIAGGAQPMWTPDGRYAIIYNGEVYNHAELRAELTAKGARFRTDHSDTEALLHAYAEWGEAMPAKLNGMFAFCIYDKPRQRLFFARDRFGEKPLFFARQNGLFAFASELSAIAAHRRFRAALNPRSVQKLMAYGFLPAPNAIYADCEKLPQGHSAIYDLTTGALTITPYWRFAFRTEPAWLERREDDLAEELRALLFQAVTRRLISDVPLGFFLSGGIDSSAVLAAAARVLPAQNLKTFTIGFTEDSYDESAHAARVAAHVQAANAVEKLDLTSARDLAPGILARLDEPLGDASILPTALLAQFTRRHVTVALSGDGGDELFAGYDPFQALAPARIYAALTPRGVHDALRAAVHRLPVSGANMSLDFKLRRTLSGLSYPQSLWNPVWLAPLDPRAIAEMFADPLPAEDLYSEALTVWERDPGLDLIDRTLAFYTNFYLPDDILVKVDRAAMMHSLESRAVLLDNDLVDFCQRLPHQWKYRNGERKYLLKRALRGLLPDAIIDRKKKGFGIPTATWLKSMPAQAPLAPIAGARLDKVAQAWADHRAGRADHRLFLWAWLSLQCFQGGPAAPARAA
jgi:asparagine synthase (glutamine-hydrolysing)